LGRSGGWHFAHAEREGEEPGSEETGKRLSGGVLREVLLSLIRKIEGAGEEPTRPGGRCEQDEETQKEREVGEGKGFSKKT